jgi:hypothetical protein
MIRWVCIFKINEYGHSGNELPPPVIGGRSFGILSDINEEVENFKDDMNELGLFMQERAERKFATKPKPYSCPDSVAWEFHQVI